MQKFHHADWLRACQSQTMQKVEIECKKLKLSEKFEIQLIDGKVAEEKLTDGQSIRFFSDQEYSLDGAIHGAIFA